MKKKKNLKFGGANTNTTGYKFPFKVQILLDIYLLMKQNLNQSRYYTLPVTIYLFVHKGYDAYIGSVIPKDMM